MIVWIIPRFDTTSHDFRNRATTLATHILALLGPTMHDHTEEEKNCWERLGIHRRNLGELLMQQSKCGSGMVPLGIVNGIIDEQKRISSVKTSLRTLGCDVPDLPDDVPRADDDGQIASAGFSALRELYFATTRYS